MKIVNWPGKNTEVDRKREATFEGWLIPTAGELDDPALARKFHRFAKRGRGDGCFRKANASQGAQAYLTVQSELAKQAAVPASTLAAFNAAKTVRSVSAAGNR